MDEIHLAQVELTEEEIQAALAVLESGMLRQGTQARAFEQEFAEYVGADHAVAVANGTLALDAAYRAVLQPGDEVLVPSFTFIATASMVEFVGGRPVFCDVEPDTFQLDLKDASSKLTAQTRAIAPVHLFGNPCWPNAIRDFAEDNELEIVWDAAHAHGATFEGADVGSLPGQSCYSFYPTKNMFVGEGGMVTTNDAEIAEELRLLRSHGTDGKYHHVYLGSNYRMTDVEAAIGRKQLERLDMMLHVRRRNARMLTRGLHQIAGVSTQTIVPDADSAWHQFCVTIDEDELGQSRDALADKLRARGVHTGVHYPRGLHQQPIFEEKYGTQTLPVTEQLSETILALPVHHLLSEQDVERILRAFQDVA